MSALARIESRELDLENEEQRLLRRIAHLEKQYNDTHEARLEAERKLQEMQHSHHAEANQKAWGKADGVTFIEKQVPEAMKLFKKKRRPDECRTALLNRICLGYNVEPFVKRPVLHQYWQNNKIYREAEERLSSKFELFFDLLFVGAIHQMSDAAAEMPNGYGLAKYILTFCPAFSVWSDVRDIMNQMGTDDVSQRLYILWIMALLVGYSINAAPIEMPLLKFYLDPHEIEEGHVSPEELHEYEIAVSSRLALQYAVGFMAIAKFSRVALCAFYGYLLPDARYGIWGGLLSTLFQAVFYFAAIFVVPRSITGVYVLVIIAISSEWLLRVAGVLVTKHAINQRSKKAEKEREELGINNISVSVVNTPGEEKDGYIPDLSQPITRTSTMDRELHGMKIPAINIEHHVDRLGAFVTIVLGELVIAVFLKTKFASGVGPSYGKAALALMLAFNLNWLYFDSGATKNYIHAIRRHWFSGFWFSLLHTPLCGALLVGSSAVNRFVTETESPKGLWWFFSGGIGVSIMIMATIGVLHKVLEVPHRIFHVRRRIIFFTRYLAGLTMILLPLAHGRLTTTEFMAICVGITVFLLIEEMALRLEKAEELT